MTDEQKAEEFISSTWGDMLDDASDGGLALCRAMVRDIFRTTGDADIDGDMTAELLTIARTEATNGARDSGYTWAEDRLSS